MVVASLTSTVRTVTIVLSRAPFFGLFCLFTCLSTLASHANSLPPADAPAASVVSPGLATGVPVPAHSGDGPDCSGSLLEIPGDGSYENAIGWQNEGTIGPDYGSFAQRFVGERIVCSIVLDLAQNGKQTTQTCDLFLWEDDNGIPGAVQLLLADMQPGIVSEWPDVNRHAFSTTTKDCSSDTLWVGYWADWPGEDAGWYVATDVDGPSTDPLTKIAPGLGFPSGWVSVSEAWGKVGSLGIGIETVTCPVEPVFETSWGRVKNLYRERSASR